LTARPIQRLPEVILGSHCLLGHVLQQQKLALYAQQLGKLPELWWSSPNGALVGI
jgi:hypothetical protein